MNLLQEKQSRYFLTAMIFCCCLLITGSGILAYQQTRSVRKVLIQQQRTVADSLLEQGIEREIIAKALTHTEDRGEGKILLEQMGHTDETWGIYMPVLIGPGNILMGEVLIFTALISSLILTICFTFLLNRHKLYRKALHIVDHYAIGDFSSHLAVSESGIIYQLFRAVENLAAMLQSKNEKEKQTREFLKETISDISHQLKTPLAALSMYNEIIADDAGDIQVVEEFSAKTSQALERINQLVHMLLKVTRLDAGSIIFEKQKHSVRALIEHAIQDLRSRAISEAKELVIEGDEEEVECDLNWTGEAVANLVKNALDHTERGQKICIRWERSPAMLRLIVEDEGCGIAQDDVHHIFKRFYRSKQSKDTQGIGLGLSLAKSIIEGQGGILSVQSSPGEGTVFVIAFLTK